MPREEIQTEIAELVGPGSMAPETIVEEVSGEYDQREVQLALVDMIEEDQLEEHPSFTGAYRLTER